jgi:hypothetical protein
MNEIPSSCLSWANCTCRTLNFFLSEVLALAYLIKASSELDPNRKSQLAVQAVQI